MTAGSYENTWQYIIRRMIEPKLWQNYDTGEHQQSNREADKWSVDSDDRLRVRLCLLRG